MQPSQWLCLVTVDDPILETKLFHPEVGQAAVGAKITVHLAVGVQRLALRVEPDAHLVLIEGPALRHLRIDYPDVTRGMVGPNEHIKPLVFAFGRTNTTHVTVIARLNNTPAVARADCTGPLLDYDW